MTGLEIDFSSDILQGAAWLSSARAVRCQVKSYNERNPCRQLPASKVGDSDGTAGANREEGGDDVKSSRPYVLGYTRATMAGTASSHSARRSESIKPVTVRIGVCNSTP